MTRRKVCARQITAGNGSCAYWFDGCPADVPHCFQRYVREHGKTDGRFKEITLPQAKAWERERDAAHAR